MDYCVCAASQCLHRLLCLRFSAECLNGLLCLRFSVFVWILVLPLSLVLMLVTIVKDRPKLSGCQSEP